MKIDPHPGDGPRFARQFARLSGLVLTGALVLMAALSLFLVIGGQPRGAGATDKAAMTTLSVRLIERFERGSEQTRFGALEFRRGLEVTSANPLFGGLSGLVVAPDRLSFVGVMDTGAWFSGRFSRDDEGLLSGFAISRIEPMRDENGRKIDTKRLVDAEGMDRFQDGLAVGFERDHRIEWRAGNAPWQVQTPHRLDYLIPPHELRRNKGMETVAASTVEGPLAGALVVVTEMSINAAGDLFAAVLAGPRKGVFFVRREAPWSVTDGKFLPDGDLLLLERRFDIANGVGMRLRRIPVAMIRPNATVDGPVLMEAGHANEIDNMEGLAVIGSDNGYTDIIVVSDDNHSMLQRTLFLEFRLPDAD